MTTVSAIAKSAFDAVAETITDAIQALTLSDGVTDYAGRAVIGGVSAPSGWPMATAKDKTREAYLEGYGVVPSSGWALGDYVVLSARDIVDAGGMTVARVIRESEMLWQAVTFQRRTITSDGAGGVSEVWATLASVTGGLVMVSGGERFASGRIEATKRLTLIVRAVSGLTEVDRVVIGGRVYAVTLVDDVERRGVWQVIDLGEGVAA